MLLAFFDLTPQQWGWIGLVGLAATFYAVWYLVLPMFGRGAGATVDAAGAVVGGARKAARRATGIDMQASAAAARLEELQSVKGITDAEVISFIAEKLSIHEVYKTLADSRYDKLPPPPLG